MKAKISYGEELYIIWKDLFPQFASFVNGYKWNPNMKHNLLLLAGEEGKNRGCIFIFSYIDGTNWRFETPKYLKNDQEG